MIVLTQHAISQYISRYNKEITFKTAQIYLEKQLIFAKKLDERSANGQELWELPSGVCLVTKRDGKEDVAVTILKQRPVNGISEEELELMQEAYERLNSPPQSIPISYNEFKYSINVEVSFQYKIPSDKDIANVEKRMRKAILNGIIGSTNFTKLESAEEIKREIVIDGIKENV